MQAEVERLQAGAGDAAAIASERDVLATRLAAMETDAETAAADLQARLATAVAEAELLKAESADVGALTAANDAYALGCLMVRCSARFRFFP